MTSLNMARRLRTSRCEVAHRGPAAKVLGSRLMQALDCLEVAGRLFDQAGIDLDELERPRVWNALAPTDILIDKDPGLYGGHVRELLERVRCGEDLSPATDAEVLCLFSEVSLKAPLNRDGFVASQLLFARIYGEQRGRDVLGEPEREQYPGAAGELVVEARRRLGAMR